MDKYKSDIERNSNFETLLIHSWLYLYQESKGDTQGSDYFVSQHSESIKKSTKCRVRGN
jgi:hypothetical protein